jgi:hypothetical protein
MRNLQVEVTEGQQRALRELKSAHDCARREGVDLTEFAVSVPLLCERVTHAELQLLVKSGLANLVEKVTRKGSKRCCYRVVADLSLSPQSCLLPTPSGIELLQRQRAEVAQGADAPGGPLPRWDDKDHTLYLGNIRVKHYAYPAPQQGALLRAFAAAAWINPITLEQAKAFGIGSGTQLKDAVNNLNKKTRAYLHFTYEGGRTRVCWAPGPRYREGTAKIPRGED